MVIDADSLSHELTGEGFAGLPLNEWIMGGASCIKRTEELCLFSLTALIREIDNEMKQCGGAQ